MARFSTMFPVVLLLVGLTVSQTLADTDHPPQHGGCHNNADCGNDATCKPDGTCECPGQLKKDYVIIPEAKPMCQKVSKIDEPCKYRDQCVPYAGNLTQCNKKGKCECYDYDKQGRDATVEYHGTCYRLTHVNGDCTMEGGATEQCKASIKPENEIKCEIPQGSRKGKCKCTEGKKCEEKEINKNGGAELTSGGISSLLSLALVGFVANKILL